MRSRSTTDHIRKRRRSCLNPSRGTAHVRHFSRVELTRSAIHRCSATSYPPDTLSARTATSTGAAGFALLAGTGAISTEQRLRWAVIYRGHSFTVPHSRSCLLSAGVPHEAATTPLHCGTFLVRIGSTRTAEHLSRGCNHAYAQERLFSCTSVIMLPVSPIFIQWKQSNASFRESRSGTCRL